MEKDEFDKLLADLKEEIDFDRLEGWSRGMEFKRKEECYDNGHQWSGGCSSDGYTWKEFCLNCSKKRTRAGYPDWWFRPIR
jgi:hypothetical protein